MEVVEETKIPLKIDAVSIKTKKKSEIVEWKMLKSQWIFYYCLILDIFILRHVRSIFCVLPKSGKSGAWIGQQRKAEMKRTQLYDFNIWRSVISSLSLRYS